ncbi:hypothetical protein D3C73_665460 [compost metagenome]
MERYVLHAQPAQPFDHTVFDERQHKAQYYTAQRNGDEAETGGLEGEHPGDHRRCGELEGDQTGSIIDQRLPLQNLHRPVGNFDLLLQRTYSHSISRRQGSRQGKGRRQRNHRKQPVDEITHCADRYKYKPQRQQQNRLFQLPERFFVGKPAVIKQQRGDEQEQEELRVKL